MKPPGRSPRPLRCPSLCPPRHRECCRRCRSRSRQQPALRHLPYSRLRAWWRLTASQCCRCPRPPLAARRPSYRIPMLPRRSAAYRVFCRRPHPDRPVRPPSGQRLPRTLRPPRTALRLPSRNRRLRAGSVRSRKRRGGAAARRSWVHHHPAWPTCHAGRRPLLRRRRRPILWRILWRIPWLPGPCRLRARAQTRRRGQANRWIQRPATRFATTQPSRPRRGSRQCRRHPAPPLPLCRRQVTEGRPRYRSGARVQPRRQAACRRTDNGGSQARRPYPRQWSAHQSQPSPRWPRLSPFVRSGPGWLRPGGPKPECPKPECPESGLANRSPHAGRTSPGAALPGSRARFRAC
jgi:hypothetical protein